MARQREEPKVRPGQVWLCPEHHEDPDADCTCGLTPYLPQSEVESLEQQLAGAVEALEAIRAELGVPTDDYPAPVANARKIADDWFNDRGARDG